MLRVVLCLVVLGITALGAVQAQAGLTVSPPTFSSIEPSNHPGELNIPQVLNQTYGGNFTLLSNGLDYSNGTLTAHRLNDVADRLWNQKITSARAIYDADAANGALSFGILPGATGGTFNSLFTESGSMTGVTGSASSLNLPNQYRLAISRDGHVFSSKDSDNADGMDRLVTYQVTGPGLGTNQNFLLGFEDGPARPFDYNDAIAVQAAAPTIGANSVAIPVPAAVWTGLSGMGAIVLLLLVRRMRRQATSA